MQHMIKERKERRKRIQGDSKIVQIDSINEYEDNSFLKKISFIKIELPTN